MSSLTRPRLGLALAALTASALLLTGCSGSEAPDAGTDTSAGSDVKQNDELHAMLPERIQKSGTLVVGTEAYYPPYEYFADDETTIVGLDPDLLDALGGVLGVEIKLENMAFDGLLPALDAKRLDMVTAAVSTNADRVKKYDMVSYFNTPQGIIVPAGNPKDVKDQTSLCGLNVSVLDASNQLTLLEEMNETVCASNPANIMAFAADTDALQQIKTGRADASLAQYPVAAYNAEHFGGGKDFTAISEPNFGASILGEVVRKDDTELRDAIQAAMNELMESGTYMQILEKHKLEVGALPKSEINQLP